MCYIQDVSLIFLTSWTLKHYTPHVFQAPTVKVQHFKPLFDQIGKRSKKRQISALYVQIIPGLITWFYFTDIKLKWKLNRVCVCVSKRPEQCLALTEAVHKSGVNRDLGACHLHWGGSETYSLRANQAQSGPQRTLWTADQAARTALNTKQVLCLSSPNFLSISPLSRAPLHARLVSIAKLVRGPCGSKKQIKK